jgi:hypothetical protein
MLRSSLLALAILAGSASPPTLIAPPDGVLFEAPDPESSEFWFNWSGSVPPYRFQLSTGKTFDHCLVDRREITESYLRMDGIKVGTFYWRVAGQSTKEGQGPFSEAAVLRVAKTKAKHHDRSHVAPRSMSPHVSAFCERRASREPARP